MQQNTAANNDNDDDGCGGGDDGDNTEKIAVTEWGLWPWRHGSNNKILVVKTNIDTIWGQRLTSKQPRMNFLT
jgi:hypothetical protein